MTGPRDPDRLIRAFLAEGPATLSERTVDGIVGATRGSRRGTGLRPWIAWRPSRDTVLAFTAGIAAVVLVATAFFVFRPTLPVGVVSTPSPTGTRSRGPEPSSAGSSGTIIYSIHDPVTNVDRIYAVPADGTSAPVLLVDDACCPALNPAISQSARRPHIAPGQAVAYTTSLPDGRKTAGLLDRLMSEPPQPLADPPATVSLTARAISTKWDVAFEAWSNQFPDLTGIYISIPGVDSVWAATRQLTHAAVRTRDVPIAFSPDGSRVLFLRVHVREIGPSLADLLVIGVDGSGLSQLNPTGVSVSWSETDPGASWSPDGQRVAMVGLSSGATEQRTPLLILDAQSGSVVARLDPTDTISGARWSPDGDWILLNNRDHSSGRLSRVHPDGTGRTWWGPLATHVYCCARWSPDGSAIVAQEWGSPSLWLLPVRDDLTVTVLPAASGEFTDYAWAAAIP